MLFDEIAKNLTTKYDEAVFKFLASEGYDIKKPYDIKQLKSIAKKLEKEDRFIDIIDYVETDFEKSTATFYYVPFFNSISNPLSQETRNEIIQKLIKMKGK